MPVFRNAAVGQPASGGPVTGSQIDDVTATYPPLTDMTNNAGPSSPFSAAGGLNAMQVYQKALAGQTANDGPMTGDGIDDALAAYPLLGSTITTPDMRDPANDDYPLAIQGLLGEGVSAQPYTDALSQLSFDPASSQPDPAPSISDAIAAPDMRDPANDDYPLAIQGLLGDGVSAQPYTDALSQLSLNTAPPPPDLHVVRPGETVSGIAHGDYAKIAAIVQANNLKLAADGSPIVRPGDLLLIPNTSGLGPAARRHQVSQGRNMVAAETQGRAQERAAKAAAQNANLKLLDRIDPPLSTPWNTWGAPDFSTGRPITSDAASGKAAAQTPAQIFGARDPRADLQFHPAGQGYYIDSQGNGYFLNDDAGGSKLTFDDREQKYWQQKSDELGRAEGYGSDGQPGMGAFGSILYSYPKYVFHAPDDVANLWGSFGSALDGLGAGFAGVGPYSPETPGGLGSYEPTYEPPKLKTDIASPNKPPVQTAYAPEAAETASPVIQLGGAHKDVKGAVPGYESHHMPANSVSPLSQGKGPAIAMIKADHERTASYGNSAKADAYRQLQADLIRQGDFRAAQQMDIQDIQETFGSKYDDAIQQMLKYSQEQGHW